MSKGEKWDRCGECHYWEWIDDDPMCIELEKKINPTGKTIHPDCPLPDWPEVSEEQIDAVRDELLKYGPPSSTYLNNWLKSIGVNIKEEKDER